MRKKKITIVISYDYEDKNIISNEKIAERIKRDLLKGSNPAHEKIENIIIEDFNCLFNHENPEILNPKES